MEYRHGGEILKAAKKVSLAAGKIIDFSVSVNPRPLSKETMAAILKAAQGLGAYPDPNHTELKEALAGYHGLKAENVLPGNGSTELIYLITQALSLNRLSTGTSRLKTLAEKKALIVEPAFSEYRRALEINNFNVSEFALPDGFYPDIDLLLTETLEGGFDLLFFANPANPTGVLTDKTEILRLARGLEGGKTVLVLDEAFIDFVTDASIIQEVAGLKNTILLRSLTKFFSIAGLRLGFIVTHAANIKGITAIQPPWSVNSVAAGAAMAAIKDKNFKDETLRWLKNERAAMVEELETIDGLRVYPPDANFIMVEITVPGVSAASVQERLLKEKGMLIRDLSNFNNLGTRFFRVAIKERVENRQLASALRGILNPVAL